MRGERERLPERSREIVLALSPIIPLPLRVSLARPVLSCAQLMPVCSKRLLRTLGWKGKENKTSTFVGLLLSLNLLGFYDIIFPPSRPNITRK